MANVDNPIGFRPVNHLLTGASRSFIQREFTLTTGATAYVGDLGSAINTGFISPSSAGDGAIVAGVIQNYKDDSASAGGKKVFVTVDPYIIYKVQSQTGGNPQETNIWNTADHVAGSGNSTTRQSGHELSSTMGTGDAQCMIIGKDERDDNAWGEHCDLLVVIHEHILKGAASTGV